MNQGRRRTDHVEPVFAPAPPPAPVHPHAVLSASLVLSLLLWVPTMQACLDGDTPLFTAAIRYVIAFGFVRIALGGFVYLLHNYRAEVDRVPIMVPALAADEPEDSAE